MENLRRIKCGVLYRIWLVLSLLYAFGCQREDAVTVSSSFRYIAAVTPELVLTSGGSEELLFRVEGQDYGFNYDISSPLCQIGLIGENGDAPKQFTISSITATAEPGIYRATITDLGIDPFYNEQACMTMTLEPGTGREKTIKSNSFTVRSESAIGGRPVIKTGLPVVYVDTDGSAPIVSKENYVEGGMIILDSVGNEMSQSRCSIRGRGNTTWEWPKKPYAIKLESKQSVLGMPKHKRWVLLANFMDKTMMRNILAYHIGGMTSLAWTPRCQSVELVLNGKHLGNYLLIEQIKVDKNRVNIDEAEGYLLELDVHYDNEIQWISHHGSCAQRSDGIPFAIKSPEPEDASPEQVDYMKEYIESTAAALYGDDFTDPLTGYRAYLDTESFIDYWIVFEIMGNHELGNPGSVYMHKDKDSKLTAGPLWDFDWGTLSYDYSPQVKNGLLNRNAIWYARLFDDPEFAVAVRRRWEELLPSLQSVPSFIDELEESLTLSAARNFAMWDASEDRSRNGGHIINGDEYMSFHDAVARLKAIYTERLDIITENLP